MSGTRPTCPFPSKQPPHFFFSRARRESLTCYAATCQAGSVQYSIAGGSNLSGSHRNDDGQGLLSWKVQKKQLVRRHREQVRGAHIKLRANFTTVYSVYIASFWRPGLWYTFSSSNRVECEKKEREVSPVANRLNHCGLMDFLIDNGSSPLDQEGQTFVSCSFPPLYFANGVYSTVSARVRVNSSGMF
jgi:hypothetical protein